MLICTIKAHTIEELADELDDAHDFIMRNEKCMHESDGWKSFNENSLRCNLSGTVSEKREYTISTHAHVTVEAYDEADARGIYEGGDIKLNDIEFGEDYEIIDGDDDGED
jgi:hypothetical protein